MKFLASYLVRFYQLFVSPAIHLLVGPSAGCRHQVTCSEYLRRSLIEFGFFKGLYLGTKRILNCHPWGSVGVNNG